MKKLSKLVALLLAGAMAMLMLTACGSNISGEDKQAEEAVMTQIRAKGSATQNLDNDRELRNIAAQNLDNDINIGFGNYLFTSKVHLKGIKPAEENIVFTITAKYDYTDTRLDKLLDRLLAKINSDGNNDSGININESGNWTKVGVVVKNVKGQSYLAISIQVKNPRYKK